jgi:hypothetical protein
MSKTKRNFLIFTGIGLVGAVIVAWTQGVFSAETQVDVLRTCSDGFFIAGGLLLAIGGIIWYYNRGALDGIGYSIKMARQRMKRVLESERTTFLEYCEQREEKAFSPKAMLLAGLVHFVIAIVLVVAYAMAAGYL